MGVPLAAVAPFCMSFVSGKGGVGKTMLAANLAYELSSNGKKVLFIDLDVDNRGATGLFSAYCGSFNFKFPDLIERGIQGLELPQIHKNIRFLPIVLSESVLDDIQTLKALPMGEIVKFLNGVLQQASAEYQVVILDCHGGLDKFSACAAAQADVTLLITEADPVTFGGTLSLVSYYGAMARNVEWRSEVMLVVNRVDPGIDVAALKIVYEQRIGETLSTLANYKGVSAFIPAERTVGTTFGRYPFSSELAPNSLPAKKIRLLLFDILVSRRPDILPKQIPYQYMDGNRLNTLREEVKPEYYKRQKRIMGGVTFVFLSTLFFSILLIIMLFLDIEVLWEFGGVSAIAFTLSIMVSFSYVGWNLLRENWDRQKVLRREISLIWSTSTAIPTLQLWWAKVLVGFLAASTLAFSLGAVASLLVFIGLS